MNVNLFENHLVNFTKDLILDNFTLNTVELDKLFSHETKVDLMYIDKNLEFDTRFTEEFKIVVYKLFQFIYESTRLYTVYDGNNFTYFWNLKSASDILNKLGIDKDSQNFEKVNKLYCQFNLCDVHSLDGKNIISYEESLIDNIVNYFSLIFTNTLKPFEDTFDVSIIDFVEKEIDLDKNYFIGSGNLYVKFLDYMREYKSKYVQPQDLIVNFINNEITDVKIDTSKNGVIIFHNSEIDKTIEFKHNYIKPIEIVNYTMSLYNSLVNNGNFDYHQMLRPNMPTTNKTYLLVRKNN